MKKIRLDIACGANLQKGFIGIDIVGKPKTQATVIHDLMSFPWPFKDRSVDQVFCSHFIEHIPHGNGYNDPFFDFMNELWRIMKTEATITFIAPYYTSQRSVQDPTHMRSIGEATFLYVDADWRKMNRLTHYPVDTNFKVVSINHSISEEFTGKSQEAVMYAGTHYFNVISDIIVVLRKPKM